MIPSQLRNTSSVYVKFDNDMGIVLDCGEGTYYQLLAHFGTNRLESILKNIQIIYITHIHGDHHFGFLQLIKERSRLTS